MVGIEKGAQCWWKADRALHAEEKIVEGRVEQSLQPFGGLSRNRMDPTPPKREVEFFGFNSTRRNQDLGGSPSSQVPKGNRASSIRRRAKNKAFLGKDTNYLLGKS